MPAAPNGAKEEIYQMVGCNNRNHLVQSKRLLPFHEDITKENVFDQSPVSPGQWTRIKLDMKHAADRELILNDIRLQFQLEFGRTGTGKVFAVRGTDLIRQMIVKINEDVVFKVEKRGELSLLWLMGNHKADGDSEAARQSYLLNQGNIPRGDAPPLYYKGSDKTWYTNRSGTSPNFTYTDDAYWTQAAMTAPTHQRHDGRPRLIYDDGSNPTYVFPFNISLNQICGPIFTRLHVRRIEYINIEIMFEPFVSREDTQEFLLFKSDPTASGAVHPYQNAQYKNVSIRQYRSTLLDGIGGFTLPDCRMLSWLTRRYSMREYSFDFDHASEITIQLKDWEIRTNITRLYWQVKPTTTLNRAAGQDNAFVPLFPPNNFDSLFGVEIWWKNDKVLDLDSTFQVYRHYVLAENKRYSLMNPFIRFYRLEVPYTNGIADGNLVNYNWNEIDKTVLANGSSNSNPQPMFEAGLYMIDFHMNVLPGVAGADIIDGIVNDTSDYSIKIKPVTDRPVPFLHSGIGTLQVFLEYQTLVNLAANSNQFNRMSQVVTKQLNMQ